jgi:hypothetical protein
VNDRDLYRRRHYQSPWVFIGTLVLVGVIILLVR